MDAYPIAKLDMVFNDGVASDANVISNLIQLSNEHGMTTLEIGTNPISSVNHRVRAAGRIGSNHPFDARKTNVAQRSCGSRVFADRMSLAEANLRVDDV